MEDILYKKTIELEDRFWWFVATHKIIESVIKRYAIELPADAVILDVGCCTGGSLPFLSQFGKNVTGMEYNSEAREIASKKGDFSI